MATACKRLELHIRQLEAGARKLGDQSRMADEAGRHDLGQEAQKRGAGTEDALVDLRREHAELRAEEEKALRVVLRLQHQAEEWRARKEKVTLAYMAGQAQDTIEEALAEAGGQRDEHDPAAHTAAARAAVEKLLATARGLEREHAEPPLALQELRPGALAGHDLRLLFGVEPSGTVLLLAAAEGPGEWHDQGLHIAEELFRGEPDRDEHTKESFLREFFPDEAEERQAGAARLLARNRVRALADVRRRRGFTLEQVAERMNATTERVAAVEGAEPGATEVGTLAAYVEAIGGRLEIVADLGSERVNLQ